MLEVKLDASSGRFLEELLGVVVEVVALHAAVAGGQGQIGSWGVCPCSGVQDKVVDEERKMNACVAARAGVGKVMLAC